MNQYQRLYDTYLNISHEYFEKLRPHCLVQDGLGKYAFPNTLELHLWAFDTMGRIACHGVNLLNIYAVQNDARVLRQLERVADALFHLIRNNPILNSPAYDGHIIEIALVLMVFGALPQFHAAARGWLTEMIGKISFAYESGRHYPVSTDSYDDLLDMNFGISKDKTQLTSLSTLFPVMLEWCLLLNSRDGYDGLLSKISSTFPHTNLQMWFPDETTEETLYTTNAGKHSGATYCSMKYPINMDDLPGEIRALQASIFDAKKLSCIEKGMPMLAHIASRHFRTPMIPYTWQEYICSTPQQPGATKT